MTANEQMRQMKQRLGLSLYEIALLFGCGEDTARQWIDDRRRMSTEFQATLERLDSETLRELGTKLRSDVVRAFNDGRNRGRLVRRNTLISQGELTQ